jgi:hypothetical protein
MPITIADLDFEHRFIVLLDINSFSELTDEQQVMMLKTVNEVSAKCLKEGRYESEKLFMGFVPTGDGFFLIGDYINSIVWGQMYIVFALTLRNTLLKSLAEFKLPSIGIKIAIHFGRTLKFDDIAGNSNFVGAGLNECSRLLSPVNVEEVSELRKAFYTHDNYVIISRLASEKLVKMPDMIRVSSEFKILAKHNRTFICRFLDMPLHLEYQILALS